jgi:hypothetical protein
MSWMKVMTKGELPVCNPRITKFAFDPQFDVYVSQNHIELTNM